jgi:hypothetical protein
LCFFFFLSSANELIGCICFIIAFQKKTTKEDKHKSISAKTSTQLFDKNEHQSLQFRRAHTDEDYRSQNRKSQVTEVKPQHKKPYQPNTQDNKPFPKHSSQKPPQLKSRGI